MTKGKNLKEKSDKCKTEISPKSAIKQSLFEAESAKVKYKDHPLIMQLHDINYNSPESVLDRMNQQ